MARGRTGKKIARRLVFQARSASTGALPFLLDLRKRMSADGANYLAGMIAFFGFLSVFPLLLLVLSVIGYLVAQDPAVQARWVQTVSGAFPGLQSVLVENLEAITRARRTAGIAGLAGFLWLGMGVVGAARFAVGRVLGVPPAAESFLRQKLASLAAIAALGSVALSSAILGGFVVASAREAWIVLRIVAGAGVLGLDFILFFFSYVLFTRAARSSWRHLWPGALVAAIGWTGLRLAGSWYAARVVSGAAQVYGAFAAALGVLTILFVGARFFIYGAELNGLIIDRKKSAKAPAAPPAPARRPKLASRSS